jgi:hypothetical protein
MADNIIQKLDSIFSFSSRSKLDDIERLLPQLTDAIWNYLGFIGDSSSCSSIFLLYQYSTLVKLEAIAVWIWRDWACSNDQKYLPVVYDYLKSVGLLNNKIVQLQCGDNQLWPLKYNLLLHTSLLSMLENVVRKIAKFETAISDQNANLMNLWLDTFIYLDFYYPCMRILPGLHKMTTECFLSGLQKTMTECFRSQNYDSCLAKQRITDDSLFFSALDVFYISTCPFFIYRSYDAYPRLAGILPLKTIIFNLETFICSSRRYCNAAQWSPSLTKCVTGALRFLTNADHWKPILPEKTFCTCLVKIVEQNKLYKTWISDVDNAHLLYSVFSYIVWRKCHEWRKYHKMVYYINSASQIRLNDKNWTSLLQADRCKSLKRITYCLLPYISDISDFLRLNQTDEIVNYYLNDLEYMVDFREYLYSLLLLSTNNNIQVSLAKAHKIHMLLQLKYEFGIDLWNQRDIIYDTIWMLSFNCEIAMQLKENEIYVRAIRGGPLYNYNDAISGTLWNLGYHQDYIQNIMCDPLPPMNGIPLHRPERNFLLPRYDMLISYSHHDENFAYHIKDHLSASGYDIFIRSDFRNFRENNFISLMKAVQSTNRMLVCLNGNYELDAMCKTEVQYAYKNNYIIIPILMEECYSPRSEWLHTIVAQSMSPIDLSMATSFFDALSFIVEVLRKERNKTIDLMSLTENRKMYHYKEIRTWKSEDIRDWCEDNNLLLISKLLKNFDGDSLMVLFNSGCDTQILIDLLQDETDATSSKLDRSDFYNFRSLLDKYIIVRTKSCNLNTELEVNNFRIFTVNLSLSAIQSLQREF